MVVAASVTLAGACSYADSPGLELAQEACADVAPLDPVAQTDDLAEMPQHLRREFEPRRVTLGDALEKDQNSVHKSLYDAAVAVLEWADELEYAAEAPAVPDGMVYYGTANVVDLFIAECRQITSVT